MQLQVQDSYLEPSVAKFHDPLSNGTDALSPTPLALKHLDPKPVAAWLESPAFAARGAAGCGRGSPCFVL